MLAAMIERQIAAMETQLGESADWMRDLFAASRAGFFKFAMFMPLARHRVAVSTELSHIARIAAAASEDCGPCVNISVRYAVDDGMSWDLARAAALGSLRDMNADQQLVWRFATAVASNAPEAGELADQIERHLGRKAQVDLAVAIACTRMFPTIKRALGYGQSCSVVPLTAPDEARRDAA